MTGTLTFPGEHRHAISVFRSNMDSRNDKILCFALHREYSIFSMVPINTTILHGLSIPHVDIRHYHRHW